MDKQVTIVVGLIVNEKRELLIARRKDPDVPEADNKWEFVGGKIEFAESPEKALVREVEEETGLKVEIVRLLPKVFTNLWTKAQGEEFQVLILCYECKIIGGKLHDKEFDPKISELRFIAAKEINKFETLKLLDAIVECFLSSN